MLLRSFLHLQQQQQQGKKDEKTRSIPETAIFLPKGSNASEDFYGRQAIEHNSSEYNVIYTHNLSNGGEMNQRQFILLNYYKWIGFAIL